MDKILIKRGMKEKLEKSLPLSQGELFLAKDEERLYVGGPKGNIPIPTQKDVDEKHQEVVTQLADIKKSYKTKSPSFTIVDDDAYTGVYTTLKPMLDARGIKGTIAVITGFVGKSGHMTESQLLDLKNNGWELVSHTHSHEDLTTLSEQELHEEFSKSKAYIERLGGNPNVLVYPYGRYNKKVVDVAAQYFDCALRTGRGQNYQPLNTYGIHRISVGQFGSNDWQYIKKAIDECIEKNLLCVICTHVGRNNEEQNALVEQVLDYVINLGYKWETFSEAYNKHKNVFDHGEYIEETDSLAFSVGARGELGGYEVGVTKWLPPDTVNAHTKPTDFEAGKITYCRISSDRSGLPTNVKGLLITNAVGFDPVDALNIYQEYRPGMSNTVYTRTAIGVDRWGEWIEKLTEENETTRVSDINEFNGDTELKDFPLGITYTIIQADKGVGLPFSGDKFSGGVLITYKSSNYSSLAGMNYQEFKEFNSNNMWIRHAGPTGWGKWMEKLTEDSATARVSDINEFNGDTELKDFPLGITCTIIQEAHGVGLPSSKGGVLITYKSSNYSIVAGMNYQEFKEFNSTKIWIRSAGPDGWGEWVEQLTEDSATARVSDMNEFNGDTELKDFPLGITYTVIQAAQGVGLPSSSGGVLITYKLASHSALAGMNYQEFKEFNSTKIWIRSAGPDGWGKWVEK